MSKVKILLIFGTIISIMPYLGFPFALRNLLITLCGFEIIYLSYLFYKEGRGAEAPEVFENFSENKDFIAIVESQETTQPQ